VLDGRPALVWGAGPVGKLHARVLLDAGVEVAAFAEVDERKIGKRIYGIPVVSHDEGLRGGVALGAVAARQPGRACASSPVSKGAARATTSSPSRRAAGGAAGSCQAASLPGQPGLSRSRSPTSATTTAGTSTLRVSVIGRFERRHRERCGV
jgi:hypothetical protein